MNSGALKKNNFCLKLWRLFCGLYAVYFFSVEVANHLLLNQTCMEHTMHKHSSPVEIILENHCIENTTKWAVPVEIL